MNSFVDSCGEFDNECQVFATCKQCHQSFDSKTSLAKHMFLHREGFICIHCNKPFASESGLRRHTNANHKNSKPVPYCDICGQSFRIKRDLEKHHLACHRADKYFKCRFCGAEFSWLTNLQKHELFHTNIDPNVEYSPKEGTKTHTENSLKKRQQSSQNNSNEEKSFRCHVCGKQFQFDFSYAIHLEGHKKAVETDVSASEPSSSGTGSCMEQEDSLKSSVEVLLEIVPGGGSNEDDEVVSIKKIEGNKSLIVDAGTDEPETTVGKIGSTLMGEEDEELLQYLKECRTRREERLMKKRRPDSPIYDCVMTAEKPFRCDLCGESFRWEVSLTIHAKVHVDGKAVKFRKMYQRHNKPMTRLRKSGNAKCNVSLKAADDSVAMFDDVESEDADDTVEPNDESDDGMVDRSASAAEDEVVMLQDESLNAKVEVPVDKESVAKADKFLERMTNVLKSKWNPQNKIGAQKKNVIGQVVLLDNKKRLSVSDGKLVSSDGTQYLVSGGLLYMINGQSTSQLEGGQSIVSFINDYAEPSSSNCERVDQMFPGGECVIDSTCDLSVNVINT